MKLYYADQLTELYVGDSRTAELPSADLVITDPPYGIGKAPWDTHFPLDILERASHVSQAMALMVGVNNLARMPEQLGPQEYRWTIALHTVNGTSRGRIGFGNWIPVMLYSREGYRFGMGKDCADIPILNTHNSPDHPSPKPIRAMTWLVNRLAGATILDPFAGSGTTLVAAKHLGRRAIGIELSPLYAAMAASRLRQETLGLLAEEPLELPPPPLPIGSTYPEETADHEAL